MHPSAQLASPKDTSTTTTSVTQPRLHNIPSQPASSSTSTTAVSKVKTTQPAVKNSTFNCQFCAKQYQHRSGLYKHMQQQHNSETMSKSINTIACKEDGCKYTCRYLAQLREHLSEQHLFTFDKQTKEFKNMEGVSPPNYNAYTYINIITYKVHKLVK